ncbi:NMD3-domain-containing protein [Ascodesmis nigricans]|uniref:60S ribosomal export protein NMD3 n=1 Tax=Ascodesmis nigricans TaxID=341454 RepID=A0A4S2N241_9PEZI|nr:NMD3-domain-containing protein [Ascodesmis nigricans]
MDSDAPVSFTPFTGEDSRATILCATCGAPISGSSGVAMCQNCIRLNVDISSGIQREATIHFCKGCERYLQPPSHWVRAELESKELLAMCLRKLRGLQKVRLIDASFIWTEPHSKRIKLKVKVQDAFQNTYLIQTFEVEFVVVYAQCPDCAKTYTPNTWRAAVQVRQKVPHKRTFLYLEQLILKHNAHKECINIREVKDGLDFFFAHRNSAVKLVDFLSSVVPVKSHKSSELISQDIHTSTKSYKFTYSVELVPICKDDLVCLTPKLAKSLGNISQLLLCTRVGNSLHLMDPNTLQTAEISNQTFWRDPFSSLADVTELKEYFILDIVPTGETFGRFTLADVEVMRASDNAQFTIRTHLGSLLHPGDDALGYHLSNSNFNDANFDGLTEANIPPVILVKKHYPRRKKNKSRNWKLKHMGREESEMLPRKQDQDRAERDYELFLREIEEDAELRGTLQLYKDKKAQEAKEAKERGDGMDVDMESVAETEDGGAGLPEISMDELLDEFEEMKLDADGDHNM